MKTITLLSVPLMLSLAACGSGKQSGMVVYRGAPPYSAAQKAKDSRQIKTFCPNCKLPLDYGSDRCSQKPCKELKIGWKALRSVKGPHTPVEVPSSCRTICASPMLRATTA